MGCVTRAPQRRAGIVSDFAPDPFNPACPSRRLLDRIGDRWTVLIVVALDPGPQRFGALASRVGGISQKMLTQTLRSLERDGFVTRTAYPEIPPRVEYALTPSGAPCSGRCARWRSGPSPICPLSPATSRGMPPLPPTERAALAAAADPFSGSC